MLGLDDCISRRPPQRIPKAGRLSPICTCFRPKHRATRPRLTGGTGSREKVPPRLPAYDISYPRIFTPPSSRFLGTNNGKLAPPNFLIADNKAHRFATQEYLILNS